MRQTEYFIRKDFWTGYYKLTPRTRTRPGEAIVAYLLIFGFILLIMALIISTLSFWIVLFGLSVKREYRFQIGIFAIIALLYFYLDIHNHWLSSLLFLGYHDEKGELVNGFLGFGGLKYFHILNLTSAIIGLGYIIDSYLYRASQDKKNHANEWLIYGISIVIGFCFSKMITSKYFKDAEDFISQNKLSVVNTENDSKTANLVNVPIDTTTFILPQKEEANVIADTASNNPIKAIIKDNSTTINDYFNDVSRNDFDAHKYFADIVYKYITLRSVSPNDINFSFENDSKEYTNQSFKYDTSTIEYANEVDGVKYYKLWIDFECFRTSKQKHQKSKMLLMYGLNEDLKLYYFNYLKVEETIYY